MAREDVRIEARDWIETHIPSGTACCNFGGWAGDVPLPTFAEHWWRIMQFEGSFGRDAVEETLDFLAANKPDRKYYFYGVHSGNRSLERGSWDLVNSSRCAYVLLHRHPLSYSQVDSAFAAQLADRGRRIRVWRPEGLAEAHPQYDPFDGYYLPVADFGPLRQQGPEIELWRLDDYPEGEGRAQGAREVFAWTYFIWGAQMRSQGQTDRARALLDRVMALKARDASLYNDLGVEYLKLNVPRAAVAAWERAIEQYPAHGLALYNIALILQLELDEPERAIPYWHRALAAGEADADLYSYLADAYIRSGNRNEALRWINQALARFPDSPQAAQIRETLGVGQTPR